MPIGPLPDSSPPLPPGPLHRQAARPARVARRCAATSPASPRLAGPALRRRRRPHGRDRRRRRSPRAGAEIRQVRPDGRGRQARRARLRRHRASRTPTGLRALYEFFHADDPRARPERPAGRARHAARASAEPPRRRSPSARSRASCAPPPRSCARARRASSSTSRPAPRPTRSRRCASCSRAKSAYVSGQVIRIGAGEPDRPAGLGAAARRPRRGRHRRLARHRRGDRRDAGARRRDVVGVDVPAQGEELADGGQRDRRLLAAARHHRRGRARAARRAPDASATAAPTSSSTTPASRATARSGGCPRTSGTSCSAINLTAQERINDALLDGGVLRAGRADRHRLLDRAGSPATAARPTTRASKAGVIGIVEALAPVLAERGQTINAVAPGFIETKMTAAMPLGTREAGRRMNSRRPGRAARRRRRDDRAGWRARRPAASTATSCASAARA